MRCGARCAVAIRPSSVRPYVSRSRSRRHRIDNRRATIHQPASYRTVVSYPKIRLRGSSSLLRRFKPNLAYENEDPSKRKKKFAPLGRMLSSMVSILAWFVLMVRYPLEEPTRFFFRENRFVLLFVFTQLCPKTVRVIGKLSILFRCESKRHNLRERTRASGTSEYGDFVNRGPALNEHRASCSGACQ